jgi:hypothetical protein
VWDLGDIWTAILCLERLATLRIPDDPQSAARLVAAAAAWRDAVGLPRPPVEKVRCERAIAAVRAALGDDAFAVAWADGQSLTPPQAIAEALQSERD